MIDTQEIQTGPRGGGQLPQAMRRFISRNLSDLNVLESEIELRREEWLSDVGDDHNKSALIFDNEDLVAFAIVKRDWNKTSARHVGKLRIATDWECWNRGYGTATLGNVIAQIYRDPPSERILRIEATPYAPLDPWKYHLLIEKYGFEIEGTLHRKVRKGSTYLDMLMMAKLL